MTYEKSRLGGLMWAMVCKAWAWVWAFYLDTLTKPRGKAKNKFWSVFVSSFFIKATYARSEKQKIDIEHLFYLHSIHTLLTQHLITPPPMQYFNADRKCHKVFKAPPPMQNYHAGEKPAAKIKRQGRKLQLCSTPSARLCYLLPLPNTGKGKACNLPFLSLR